VPRPQFTNLLRNHLELSEMLNHESNHIDHENHEVRNDPPVRTLRDYLQPIRGSTPSCVVSSPNDGTFEIKP